MGFDARAWLPDIRVPVLLVAGGADQFFTRETVEDTARLIPGSNLRICEGRDHVGALQDERLPSDVLEFVTRSARLASGEPASEAPPEPVVAEA